MGVKVARTPTIAGLGITDVGQVYGKTTTEFAAEAVRLAVGDAGLELKDVDGLLLSPGRSNDLYLDLQNVLGLRDLALLSQLKAFGASAASMIAYASMAVQAGMAEVVVCVHADTPLKPNRSAGGAYAHKAKTPTGWPGLLMGSGVSGPNHLYALAARRHMLRYGTTNDQFGAIAVAQRDWAVMNPRAQMREPLTLEDYHGSRWIAEPFHLLDCCVVSNGGIAVIITTAERAASLRQPPVHVLGWGQSHPGQYLQRNENLGLVSGASQSGPRALAMAGLALSDVDIAELYDCYTFTVLLTLEDYGFCDKGDGGAFVDSGTLGPAGSLKVNTGGGQLSSYYLWGMTPLSEAVIQIRGQAEQRQVERHDIAIVSGNGGIFDYHSTLVLGSASTQMVAHRC